MKAPQDPVLGDHADGGGGGGGGGGGALSLWHCISRICYLIAIHPRPYACHVLCSYIHNLPCVE